MFKALIVALAAVAVAVPTHPQHGGNNEAGNVCGNGSTLHCCNSETANKVTSGGLAALDLENLLGGQCNTFTIPVIGVAVPISNTCTNQAVCCNKTNQNGLVNISCVPITL